MRFLIALLVLLAISAPASNVVISYTNSSTGTLDTNDFRTVPLSNVANADGTYNTIGLPRRYHNPTGLVTNFYVQNNYLLTNSATGFWLQFRVPDSSTNLVTLGSIAGPQNSNPFWTLIINTNIAGTGGSATNVDYTVGGVLENLTTNAGFSSTGTNAIKVVSSGVIVNSNLASLIPGGVGQWTVKSPDGNIIQTDKGKRWLDTFTPITGTYLSPTDGFLHAGNAGGFDGGNLTNIQAEIITGTLTNNTTGSAATALAGWPLEWPSAAITNAPWLTGSSNLAGANITDGTISSNAMDSAAYAAFTASASGISAATATNIAAYQAQIATNGLTGGGGGFVSTATTNLNMAGYDITNVNNLSVNGSLTASNAVLYGVTLLGVNGLGTMAEADTNDYVSTNRFRSWTNTLGSAAFTASSAYDAAGAALAATNGLGSLARSNSLDYSLVDNAPWSSETNFTTRNVRFVDAGNGSDLNDGTASRPWATIQFAQTNTPVSWTIAVAPGSYADIATNTGVCFYLSTEATVTFNISTVPPAGANPVFSVRGNGNVIVYSTFYGTNDFECDSFKLLGSILQEDYDVSTIHCKNFDCYNGGNAAIYGRSLPHFAILSVVCDTAIVGSLVDDVSDVAISVIASKQITFTGGSAIDFSDTSLISSPFLSSDANSIPYTAYGTSGFKYHVGYTESVGSWGSLLIRMIGNPVFTNSVTSLSPLTGPYQTP